MHTAALHKSSGDLMVYLLCVNHPLIQQFASIPVKVYPHKAPVLPAGSGLSVSLLIAMLIRSVLHKKT